MSSGFTSGGSLDNPIARDDEWLKAQKELDQERARKAEIERQQGGKSLYEILQSNKAAKQEQFEESIKLKNQFRALDDDEIDFLDSVIEKEREKEAAVKKDTELQLESFTKAQHEDQSLAKLNDPDATKPSGDQDWSVRPKRKRQEKEGFRGLKFSKTAAAPAAVAKPSAPTKPKVSESTGSKVTEDSETQVQKTADAKDMSNNTTKESKSGGLVAYASSDDSDADD